MVSKSEETVHQIGLEMESERARSQEKVLYQTGSTTTIHTQFWRVRLELAFDRKALLGLDIYDEVTIGRGDGSEDVITLFNAEDASQLGVSRKHCMLRATANQLFVIDLGSTNGTRLNGYMIGPHSPYNVSDGDLLTVGRMDLIVNIVQHPKGLTSALNEDRYTRLREIAAAIMSHLNHRAILEQSVEMIMLHTSASEAGLWLVDEETGELYLEAGRGIEDDAVRRLSLNNTLPGMVIETGRAIRANSRDSSGQIKVKTGYLVEAVIYVPLKVAGITIGVLSAVHRVPDEAFDTDEEKLMTAIADFTAIALQKSRQYNIVENVLNSRKKTMTTLNYTLAFDLKNLVNATIGYASLLAGSAQLDDFNLYALSNILGNGETIIRLIDRLNEVLSLGDASMDPSPCDLLETTRKAITDLEQAAAQKDTLLELEIVGEPKLIHGQCMYLYRTAYNLIENAIKYSPEHAHVLVTLAFMEHEIVLRVRDDGPGIDEDDLPHLFDQCYRGDNGVGVGLGLELVRAVVEAHKGQLIARNIEDQGAEFIITLPVNTI